MACRAWKRSPVDVFHYITQHSPLISVDLLIRRYVDGEAQYLVGLRTNNPAQGALFVPGSRIWKDEPVKEAVRRALHVECGLQASSVVALGLYEHWYPNNFCDDLTSTQYFSIAHLVDISGDMIPRPDHQHRDFHWLTKQQILDHNNIHPYVKYFFQDNPPNIILGHGI